MKNFLFIDTSERTTKIAVFSRGLDFNHVIEWDGGQNQSEELLSKVDELLTDGKLTISDLSGIVVVSGPGSYTGLRVGVASANALAYALNIPVSEVTFQEKEDFNKIVESSRKAKINSPVLVIYNHPPHITTPKKI